MQLLEYFEVDDGSLPEIEVTFAGPKQVAQAFEYLFKLGAIVGEDASIWLTTTQSERPFSGPRDIALVTTGSAGSFHVVLSGITHSGCVFPDLGVFVAPDVLVLDYRMGSAWGQPQVLALLSLLQDFLSFGGAISVVHWWGTVGQHAFLDAMGT